MHLDAPQREDDQDQVLPSDSFNTRQALYPTLYSIMGMSCPPLVPFPNIPIQVSLSPYVDGYGAGLNYTMPNCQGASTLYPAGDTVLPTFNVANPSFHQSLSPFSGMSNPQVSYLSVLEASLSAPATRDSTDSGQFLSPVQAQKYAEQVRAAQLAHWRSRVARGTVPSTELTQACGLVDEEGCRTDVGYHEFPCVPDEQPNQRENQSGTSSEKENAATGPGKCNDMMVYVTLTNTPTTEGGRGILSGVQRRSPSAAKKTTQ